MSFFAGHFWHSLDQKNRLFIPTKLREALGGSFIIYKPQNGDKCLFAYTLSDWEELSNQLNNQPASKKLTELQRSTYLRLDTVSVDNQWRITLSNEFCEFAGLEKEVFILGAGKRLEIWSRSEYDAMLKRNEERLEKAKENGEDIEIHLPF